MVPWDTGVVPPEIVALADRLPPGRALDLGCGTGVSAVYLAQRGWRVTGIDFIPEAIRRARERARAAHQVVDFYVADVTRPEFLQPPFDLIFDVGCLHNLPRREQVAYAAHVARLARVGATYALYAFAPHKRQGRQIGLSPQDVAALFGPTFVVESVVRGMDTARNLPSAWYTLQRTAHSDLVQI